LSGENGINPDGNLNLWEARFGLRMKLRPTGACDLSSVLSAIGLATAEGPAEEDGRRGIARPSTPLGTLSLSNGQAGFLYHSAERSFFSCGHFLCFLRYLVVH
jgi:hypothetical protein